MTDTPTDPKPPRLADWEDEGGAMRPARPERRSPSLARFAPFAIAIAAGATALVAVKLLTRTASRAPRFIGQEKPMTATETLMDWLRDAHAMEEQGEEMLSRTADRLNDYPELQAKLREHYAQTQSQSERLRGCIERRGGDISTLKTWMGKLTGIGQAMSGLLVDDEVVKASMASYTFEHMEISAYKVLIAAAQQVGDTETARVCTEILAEETAMADWLNARMEQVTTQYLSRLPRA